VGGYLALINQDRDARADKMLTAIRGKRLTYRRIGEAAYA
jgi:hypothetical protein